MPPKMLFSLGVVLAAGMATNSSAFASGAGASARANMHIPVKSLAKTVALAPRGIRRTLRARGYYNIRFIDRTLPVYKVRACRNGKKFRVRLNRWGDVRRRVKIGWCDGGNDSARVNGASFPEIRRKLRHRGYHRIRFTDRHLPGYRAKACKRGKRYTLWLNRWGRIMERDRRGWCGYGRRDDHRHIPYVRYDGPGISITLGKKRHRY